MLSHLGRREGKMDELGAKKTEIDGHLRGQEPLRSACVGTSWYVERVFTLIEIAYIIQVLLEPLSQSQV